MRNRQFSYDEGEDDYYDEEEEDRLIEEHRLQMLEARGEAPGSRGGGISLSSYFDDLPRSTPQLQQQSEPPQQTHGGRAPPGYSDRHAPDKSHQSAGGEDAELVDAIAAELENRLGRGRFPAEQVRQAVQTSGYEVDVAEAILLSTGEAGATASAATEQQVQFSAGIGNSNMSTGGSGSSKVAAPPPGLPPTAPGYNNHPPSSLAFGLCIDGRPGAAATTTTDNPAASSSRAGISSSAAAAGLAQFGFDTPSPDDLNLSKQAAARGGGGGGGGNAGRNADAFSSPKAKVVHISGSTPKTTGGRKSVTGTPSAATPTPTKGRTQSPTAGGVFSPSPQQSAAAAAAAQAIDDIDDAQAGGKERLAMVVIGHVDAGKSTLMGQVRIFFFCVCVVSYTRNGSSEGTRLVNVAVALARRSPRFSVDVVVAWRLSLSRNSRRSQEWKSSP